VTGSIKREELFLNFAWLEYFGSSNTKTCTMFYKFAESRNPTTHTHTTDPGSTADPLIIMQIQQSSK